MLCLWGLPTFVGLLSVWLSAAAATQAQVDPQEPTETLHKFRSGHVLGWTEPKSWKHAVFFGVNLCLGQGSGLGRLAVGDRLEVRTTREGPPGPIAAA